tara:strand:- start:242 stop:388 length:147 start_codon:yes stop_codon:yes gene_type:complete
VIEFIIIINPNNESNNSLQMFVKSNVCLEPVVSTSFEDTLKNLWMKKY